MSAFGQEGTVARDPSNVSNASDTGRSSLEDGRRQPTRSRHSISRKANTSLAALFVKGRAVADSANYDAPVRRPVRRLGGWL
jgi:hypothetical protein